MAFVIVGIANKGLFLALSKRNKFNYRIAVFKFEKIYRRILNVREIYALHCFSVTAKYRSGAVVGSSFVVREYCAAISVKLRHRACGNTSAICGKYPRLAVLFHALRLLAGAPFVAIVVYARHHIKERLALAHTLKNRDYFCSLTIVFIGKLVLYNIFVYSRLLCGKHDISALGGIYLLKVTGDANVVINSDSKPIDRFTFDKNIKSITWLDNGENVEYSVSENEITVVPNTFDYGTNLVVRVAKIETEN